MILYLHGFNSSSASSKAQDTIKACKEANINCIAPDLPHQPKLVYELFDEIYQSANEKIFAVGSSLGGYYTTYLVEKGIAVHGVLINPAVGVADLLIDEIGKEQENYNTAEKYIFTQCHYDELKQIEYAKIADPSKYLLLVQKGDEILDYKVAVDYYAGAKQIVEEGGDHSFVDYEKHLPEIINLAKQL